MESQDRSSWNGRILGGLFLLVVGSILFMKQFGFPLPIWLFKWPSWMIVIGLFLGVRHGFRGPAWIILIVIGSVFFIDMAKSGFSLRRYLAPIIIVALGVLMILRPRGSLYRGRRDLRNNRRNEWNQNEPAINQTQAYTETIPSHDPLKQDYIDSVAIFGGVRKVIVSKNFKGGDLVSILGGNEIDLSKADINGKAVMEVTAILGGVKLIIPSHWDVKSELVALFGGIEDKRQIPPGATNPEKILILKGTSIFGGIDIRNY